MNDLDVPQYMSQRLAAFISSRSRRTIAQLPKHGRSRQQVARTDLESLMGYRISRHMFDQALVALRRAGIANG